jgi:hypothetical protein
MFCDLITLILKFFFDELKQETLDDIYTFLYNIIKRYQRFYIKLYNKRPKYDTTANLTCFLYKNKKKKCMKPSIKHKLVVLDFN